jgi:hypothetical protein
MEITSMQHISSKLTLIHEDLQELINITRSRNDINVSDFSQHSCTNVFTAVADLQVQYIYILYKLFKLTKPYMILIPPVML